MTVCIAAACDGGRKVVTATDGLLSFSGITADVMAAKMYWQNDWLYLYAGKPSNAKLMFEECFYVNEGEPLNRENIQSVTLKAYQKRRAHLASFGTLSAFDITVEQFWAEGRNKFTESEFTRLAQAISEQDKYFEEQLLVVGWGKAESAVMLYELSPWGTQDHALSGVAAIGNGSEVALSTLLLLGQSRDSGLADTIYTVAAAKFASEKSEGRTVGDHTAIRVTWKRKEGDDSGKPPGSFLPQDQIEELRDLWEKYGKPKIPDEAWKILPAVCQSIGFKAEVGPVQLAKMFRRLASQKSEPEK